MFPKPPSPDGGFCFVRPGRMARRSGSRALGEGVQLARPLVAPGSL